MREAKHMGYFMHHHVRRLGKPGMCWLGARVSRIIASEGEHAGAGADIGISENEVPFWPWINVRIRHSEEAIGIAGLVEIQRSADFSCI